MSGKAVQAEMFDISEMDNVNYSVKSDVLATALLGDHIKPTYKRCFEGLLTKMKSVDVELFISEDKPLRVRLSPQEYNIMFPRFNKGIPKVFEGAAAYYSQNSSLAVPQEENPEKLRHINVVDSALVLPSGELEILFTRSILPHLSDVKKRLLVIDISQFGFLTSKYSQKLYETFSSWRLKCDIFRADINYLRVILCVPPGYSDYKFRTLILDRSIKEINTKTTMRVSYNSEKGAKGKAIKYLTFILGLDDAEELENNQQDTLLLAPELVNTFVSEGVTDKQFFAIVDLRLSHNKPTAQAAIESYIDKLVNISKKPETLDLEEILGMLLAQGWKGWPQLKYFINPSYTGKSRSNPKPKMAELPAEKPDGVTSAIDMLKNARQK